MLAALAYEDGCICRSSDNVLERKSSHGTKIAALAAASFPADTSRSLQRSRSVPLQSEFQAGYDDKW